MHKLILSIRDIFIPPARKKGEFIVYPLNGEDPVSMTYKEYLWSDYWKMRRNIFGKRAGWKCEHCGHGIIRDLDMHHKHYKTLGNEQYKDIVVLCRECHKKQHPGWD